MEFQIIWFIIWGLLWTIYFMLDGFDLGAGTLYYFLSKDETEKRIIINTIGPVWDGNEVWVITAGGATFAAFPGTYASMFSFLYSALLLLLFALIFRGLGLEFARKHDTKLWMKGWDAAIFLGSLLPALLFGVAFGNIFRGLPFNADGYYGSLFYLLNPYGLVTGILFVILFTVHGALWVAMKSGEPLDQKAAKTAGKFWYILIGIIAVFLVFSYFETHLFDNYLKNPAWFIVPALSIASLLFVKIFISKNDHFKAFFASCITVFTFMATGFIGLYPNLIPSRLDPNSSLTLFNSSSSVYTLKVMTIVVAIFVPIVIGYQIWAYRLFRGKVTADEMARSKEAY